MFPCTTLPHVNQASADIWIIIQKDERRGWSYNLIEMLTWSHKMIETLHRLLPVLVKFRTIDTYIYVQCAHTNLYIILHRLYVVRAYL